MPSPSDPTPDPQGDALARIGDILANAEREVASVVAAAESAAADGASDRARSLAERAALLDERALELDRRAAELAELTTGILSTAVEVQSYARRLSALPLLSGDESSHAALLSDLPRIDAPAAGTRAPAADRAEAPAPKAPAPLRAVDSDGWPVTTSSAARAPVAPVPTPGRTDAPSSSGPRAFSADPGAPDEDDLPIVAGDDAADPPERLDSARLIALSMAAEGRSRDEVEAHVRDTLGIIDHAALIDYVFGGSTPSSVVPGWPPRRRRSS